LKYLDALLHQKQTSADKVILDAADMELCRSEYERLTKDSQRANDASRTYWKRHQLK
jgi:hypothetical protein